MSSLRVPLTCSAGEASPDASSVPTYAQRIIPSTTMHVSCRLAPVDQVSASCMCRRECRGMRVASFSSHHFIIFPGRAFCGTWRPSGLDPSSGIGSWQWDAQKTGAWALSFFFFSSLRGSGSVMSVGLIGAQRATTSVVKSLHPRDESEAGSWTVGETWKTGRMACTALPDR